MSRIETKFRLMREFGSMMAPVHRLLDTTEPNPSPVRLAVETAQLAKDWGDYSGRVHAFCTVNGLLLALYYKTLINCVTEMFGILNARDVERARRELPELFRRAENALIAIPADDPDLMLPPQSPFQSYLRLLALCGGASTRLELFDPYLDAEVFHRYLSDVRDKVQVTLITHVNVMRDPRRRDRIIAVSELVALERSLHYQLLEVPSIHDRHLRADDKIFHLGGSPKDASKKDFYTIGETDSNQNLQKVLDRIISSSTPWYRPGMPRHLRWCSTCKQPSDVRPNGVCATCGNRS